MSTQVSNPYSFNISKNTLFDANVTPKLPDKETILLNSYGGETKEIRIPSGVKVLDIRLTCISNGELCEIYVTNITNDRKQWAYYTGRFEGEYSDTYIGVTPGKSYKISIEQIGYADGYCEILYSASINNQTPNVTDY